MLMSNVTPGRAGTKSHGREIVPVRSTAGRCVCCLLLTRVLGDCRSDRAHCIEWLDGSVASSSRGQQFLAPPLQKGSDRQVADALPVASTNPVTRGGSPPLSPPSPPSSPVPRIYLVYLRTPVLGPPCRVINDCQNPRRCSGTSRPPRRPQDHIHWCRPRSLHP